MHDSEIVRGLVIWARDSNLEPLARDVEEIARMRPQSKGFDLAFVCGRAHGFLSALMSKRLISCDLFQEACEAVGAAVRMREGVQP